MADDVELVAVEAEDRGGLPLVAAQLVAAHPDADLRVLGRLRLAGHLEGVHVVLQREQGLGPGGGGRRQEQGEREKRTSHDAVPQEIWRQGNTTQGTGAASFLRTYSNFSTSATTAPLSSRTSTVKTGSTLPSRSAAARISATRSGGAGEGAGE